MLDVRLFTGLSLPPQISATFEELLEELEPLARIRWTRARDLHITTKFIGKWPFGRMPELCNYLISMPRLPRFKITLTGLRYMSAANNSWVLYAHVENCEPLIRLAIQTDQTMKTYHVPEDHQDFVPHVTIGRIPGPNPWPELDERVESYCDKPLGTFEVTEWHLYESAATGYRKCVTVPLL
jgi:2'-5' RNA ligase